MINNTLITGQCHCGNIQYQYSINQTLASLSVRRCSCSFCSKQGAVYSSEPTGKLKITIKSKAKLKRYQFSSKSVDFMMCNVCGIMPYATTEINGGLFAIVNLTTANLDLNQFTVKTSNFTQESAEKSTNRRKSNWIAKIEIL